jgi:hypothetical protein
MRQASVPDGSAARRPPSLAAKRARWPIKANGAVIFASRSQERAELARSRTGPPAGLRPDDPKDTLGDALAFRTRFRARISVNRNV